MPALCLIINSDYYANNYAGIFDAGLVSTDYTIATVHDSYDVT